MSDTSGEASAPPTDARLTLSPVGRASVASTVIAQIQGAMRRGELRRGDRLPTEVALAEQLHVSRTSVREALKVLETLGILEVGRRSGTFVAANPRLPSIDPLLFLLLLQDGTRADLVELRSIIETGFTKAAQRRITDEQLAALERNVDELEAAVAEGRVEASHDLSFHERILEATGNPFIIQIGRTILDLFRESIGRGVQTFPERAVEHHRSIIAALVSRDPSKVDEAIERSYEFWKQQA
jgi:GntR family transcriptional regulator, transcriptional repressor for pyruvate dehydrogenase complex